MFDRKHRNKVYNTSPITHNSVIGTRNYKDIVLIKIIQCFNAIKTQFDETTLLPVLLFDNLYKSLTHDVLSVVSIFKIQCFHCYKSENTIIQLLYKRQSQTRIKFYLEI